MSDVKRSRLSDRQKLYILWVDSDFCGQLLIRKAKLAGSMHCAVLVKAGTERRKPIT